MKWSIQVPVAVFLILCALFEYRFTIARTWHERKRVACPTCTRMTTRCGDGTLLQLVSASLVPLFDATDRRAHIVDYAPPSRTEPKAQSTRCMLTKIERKLRLNDSGCATGTSRSAGNSCCAGVCYEATRGRDQSLRVVEIWKTSRTARCSLCTYAA